MAARRNDSDSKASARSRRRRPKFRHRLFLFALVTIGLLAVTPAIVATSPLRNILLNWQMPPGWGITSQHAALTWTGNQTLSKIAVTDPDLKQLAVIDTFTVERPLWRLLLSPGNLGRIQVVRPVVFVESRPEGSNIEDFLAALEQQAALTPEPARERSATSALAIVDGTVRGSNSGTDELWTIEQLELTGDINDTGLTFDGTATVTDGEAGNRGRIKYRLQQLEDGQQRLNLLAEQLPLKPFEYWLARVVPECRLSGMGALDAEARWKFDPQGELALTTAGRMEGNDVIFTAEALGGDRLRSKRITVPWKLETAGKLVAVEQLGMDADWGQFTATGSLDLAELEHFGLATLPKQEFTVSGKVILPRLAEVLPQTLQLREGVRVDSGEATLLASSRSAENGFRWKAEVSIENLAGEDQGRNIRWQQPVVAKAEWVETPDGPKLDRGSLASLFAKADFTTSKDKIQGDFTCDLGELTQQVGQFIDLAGWQFRGSTKGDFLLATKGEHQFEVDANLELNDLVVVRDNSPLWEEPNLLVKVHADGRAADLAPRVFSSGTLNLQGARDTVEVTLLEEVDFAARGPWLVQFNGSGPLESWAGRLRPWVTIIPDEITGEGSLGGKLRVKNEEFLVSDLDGRITRLHVRDGTVAIDEPRVEISGDCLWNAATHTLISNQLQFIGSILSFRSRDVKFDFPEGERPVVTGNVAFRSDLERLSAAVGLIGHQGATWPRGQITGTLNFATGAEALEAAFTLDGEQLQLVRRTETTGAVHGPPTTVWSEPKLRASGKAVYTIASDQATVDQLRIDGETMQLAGTAKWTDLSSNGPLEVRGTVEYDPNALARLIANYAGPDVQIQGDRQVQFSAAGRVAADTPDGPHWSRRWQASVSSGWRSASVYGLPLGAGTLQGSLNAGQLQIAPLDVAVGQGRLTANPRVVLDPSPQTIRLPSGPLITNVQISPEVSENMLMYVAPVLAGATRVNGMFSLVLNETRIPLADPKQTETAGRLSVHKLNIGPGPLIEDLVTLVARLEALSNPEGLLQRSPQPSTRAISMKDQQIEFQVVDGRVYHRNLEFVVDNVPVRSQGSVGFDQSLSLMVEIPIQDKWVGTKPAFRGLAGQNLKIPISGTLQRPRVDDRAVANLTGQVLRGAAEQVIGDEINRQLERLFRPRER